MTVIIRPPEILIDYTLCAYSETVFQLTRKVYVSD